MGIGLGFKDLLSNIKNLFLDTIFPVECLGCGKEGEWLCGDCFEKIRVDCHSLHGEFLDRVLTFYSYDSELLKTAIHALKYKCIEELANPLGKLFLNGFEKLNLRPASDTVVMPVPLHRKRLLERGFNQAELLARGIAEEFDCLVDGAALGRVRMTMSQVKLEKKERKSNMAGAFKVLDSSKIVNKKIILVDDVFTTGATMEECARVLKESGAKEVWGVALAKG